jgi:Mn-dependent DtxR family transcriptional regulator
MCAKYRELEVRKKKAKIKLKKGKNSVRESVSDRQLLEEFSFDIF